MLQQRFLYSTIHFFTTGLTFVLHNQFRYHRSDFCTPQCIFSIQQRFLYSAIDFFTTGVISVFHNTFLYCRNDFCTPRNISLLQERFLYSTIDFFTAEAIFVLLYSTIHLFPTRTSLLQETPSGPLFPKLELRALGGGSSNLLHKKFPPM